MKALTRVAFYALALSFVSSTSHYSYAQEPVDLVPDMASEDVSESDDSLEEDADVQKLQDEVMHGGDVGEAPTLQEAKKALDALPGAKDAVKGKISTEVDKNIYDIYGRQLAYRAGAKEYSESLNKRRENFSKPRTKMIERYQETRDVIYAAETADYQRKIKEQEAEEAGYVAHKLPSGEAISAVQEDAVLEEIGIKEQEIPSLDSEAQVVKKKVVTAGNAPAFDPARLNMNKVSAAVPVPVEGVVPPPMPEVVQEEKEVEVQQLEAVPEVVVPAVEDKVEDAVQVVEPQEDAVIDMEASEIVPVEAAINEEQGQVEVDVQGGAPVETSEEADEASVLQDEPVADDAELDAPESPFPKLVNEEDDGILNEEQFNNPFDEDTSNPFNDKNESKYND